MLESKRRAIIFFIIAILLAALSGYFVLQKVKDLNDNLGTMVKIYVADREIYSRALITPDDVTTTEIPAKYIRDEYITNVNDFQNTVSIVPLSKGQIITQNMLKQASTVTEENNRLITILQTANVFFDERLYDMDRVDIIVSHEVEGKKVTEVFMKDLKVARIATNNETKEFNGVQVEVPFDEVTDLIHMLNYAETVRVIRANVGQMPNQGNPSVEDPENEDSNLEGSEKKDTTKEDVEKETTTDSKE
ncbi:SAF domain-containing protein [Ornithinibacillus bavariensis]|uniref:SAF domain-containing protein n=1 Tax=Ornithinibacillus bavariensis TaxID=545502 RepID=A0A919X4P8_9BACI|nr:SAF domain-containing protein [Ornithinibacillus bavariensis]GIO25836.1 hypothetical protein J43TS3_04470 [Ornithinibacillus bavariensis]HAM79753.1 flp pilus assembly protein CpaB [Ornithinibacillus sp.]